MSQKNVYNHADLWKVQIFWEYRYLLCKDDVQKTSEITEMIKMNLLATISGQIIVIEIFQMEEGFIFSIDQLRSVVEVVENQ